MLKQTTILDQFKSKKSDTSQVDTIALSINYCILQFMALVCSILTLNIAGSDFEGSDKLMVMANSAPPCATSIYSEILKIPSG